MKEQPTNNIKVRSNNPFILTIILIILFIISISYMAFYKSELFNKKVVPLKEPVENNTIIHHIPERANKQMGNEQNIIKDQNYSQITPPPEENSVIANIPIKSPEPIRPNFDKYRNYLLNVNLLVSNFLQDKDFSEQLLKIHRLELPIEIQNIIENLQNYNDHFLIDREKNVTRIFPKNIPWVEKFIKIEKQHTSKQEQRDLKKKIIEQLDNFVNFFYSEKLQQKFIETNHD